MFFSILKNAPGGIPKKTFIDVNRTGMWNEDITSKFLKKVVANRPGTALLKEPMLFILYSYGSHLKLNFERLALVYNIHIVFVTKNMTSIL